MAATGEPRRRCAVIYAFLRQFSSGFRGTTGRKGGGGVSSENGTRARARAPPAANLARDPETARPSLARAHISLCNPSPISLVWTPARARLNARPAHARFLFSGFPAYGSRGCEGYNLGLPLIGWDRHLPGLWGFNIITMTCSKVHLVG